MTFRIKIFVPSINKIKKEMPSRNPWLSHVAKYRAQHPHLSFSEVLHKAKSSYSKKSKSHKSSRKSSHGGKKSRKSKKSKKSIHGGKKSRKSKKSRRSHRKVGGFSF